MAVELRRDQPTLDLHLFRKPAFTGAQIVAFTLQVSMFSMFLYLVLYMQNVLGYSPLETGVRFLPISLLSFLAAPIAGKFAEWLPVRAFLGAACCVWAWDLVMSGIDPSDDWTTLLAGFIVAGVGIGFITRRLPPRPSAWSSRDVPAPPPASTARSARWAPRSVSPASARSCSRR
jgi:predicted MFS family arabinose efflux permease